MPDFNSDKEHGQGKIKWAVRNAHKGLPIKTLKTGKGDLKLDKQGRCIINDPGLAAEVRKTYARDLSVSRVFTNDPADREHNYVFGQMPALPWHKYDEFGFRIKEEESDQTSEKEGEDGTRDE